MTLPNEFYPDLATTGALAEHLLMGIGEIDCELLVQSWPEVIASHSETKNFDGACLFSTHSDVNLYFRRRSSYLYCLAERRMFCISFSDEGIELARAQTVDLAESASLFRRWCIDYVSPTVLASEYSYLDLIERKSAKEEVDMRWKAYHDHLADGHLDLFDFYKVALHTPMLRQLYPYTSMFCFCFSRCSHYPFTTDCPHIKPKCDFKSGQVIPDYYEVFLRNRYLGEGTGEDAAQIVVRYLPRNCGPAVSCTADYL